MSEPSPSEKKTSREPSASEEVVQAGHHIDYSTSYSNLTATLELEAENSSLRAQVGRLQRTLKRQEEEFFDMQKEIAELTTSYKRKMQDKEEQIYELQEEHDQRVNEMQARYDLQKHQVRDLQESLADLKSDLDKQEREQNRLSTEMERMGQENQAWRAHYLYVRTALEQSLQQLKVENERQEELQAQINRLNHEIEKMEELLGDKELLEAENTDVATRLLQRKAEIEGLRRRQAELEKELIERGRDVLGLEQELAEAIARPGKLVDENAKLREITAEAVDRYTRLRIRFESEILAQEALKMAVEKELVAVGEAMAAMAERNLENARRWEGYIQTKDRNVTRMVELAQQLKRVKAKSLETEHAFLHNLKDHFQVPEEALPKARK